ncbi:MAG: radical SAM protein [Candidatus Omnitrophota bacterium]
MDPEDGRAAPPIQVEIEPCNLCNLRCAFCQYRLPEFHNRPLKVMSQKMFRQIMEMYDYPDLPCLQFCGTCEPLLHPELASMISWAADHIRPDKIELITSATMLGEDRAIQLAGSGLSILKASVDSPRRDIYSKIRGGDLRRVMKNLQIFHREAGIPVWINTVANAYNLRTLHEMPQFCRQIGARYLELRFLENRYRLDGVDVSYRSLRDGVLDRMHEEAAKYGIGLYVWDFAAEMNKPCLLETEANIDFCGALIPCFNLPNTEISSPLSRKPFSEVWNSAEVMRIRALLAAGRFLEECCCLRGNRNRQEQKHRDDGQRESDRRNHPRQLGDHRRQGFISGMSLAVMTGIAGGVIVPAWLWVILAAALAVVMTARMVPEPRGPPFKSNRFPPNINRIELAPDPLQRNAYLAVFDIHGTIFRPTWKQEFAHVLKAFREISNQDALKWVEEHLAELDASESWSAMMKECGVDEQQFVRVMQEERGKFAEKHVPVLMPGVLDAMRDVTALHIPSYILTDSRASRSAILRQLEQAGVLELVPADRVITREDVAHLGSGQDTDHRKDIAFRYLQDQFPAHRIISFNDWIDGGEALKELSGIMVGLPQGPAGSREQRKNIRLLYENGTDIMFKQGWGDWPCLKQQLTLGLKDQGLETIFSRQGTEQSLKTICQKERSQANENTGFSSEKGIRNRYQDKKAAVERRLTEVFQGCFEDFRTGPGTMKHLRRIFEQQQDLILVLLRKLNHAERYLAVIDGRRGDYTILSRSFFAGCGLCFTVCDCLLGAARQSGIDAGIYNREMFREHIVVAGETLHVYPVLKLEDKDAAMDLTAGQFGNQYVASPLVVDAAEKHRKNIRLELGRLISTNGSVPFLAEQERKFRRVRARITKISARQAARFLATDNQGGDEDREPDDAVNGAVNPSAERSHNRKTSASGFVSFNVLALFALPAGMTAAVTHSWILIGVALAAALVLVVFSVPFHDGAGERRGAISQKAGAAADIGQKIDVHIPQDFIFPEADIIQREINVRPEQNEQWIVSHVRINRTGYAVGAGHYLEIRLADGRRVYWVGQHGLVPVCLCDHYQEKIADIIRDGGLRWGYLDAHNDIYGYHVKRPALDGWQMIRRWAARVLKSHNYLSGLVDLGLIKNIRKYRLDQDPDDHRLLRMPVPAELHMLEAEHDQSLDVFDLDIDVIVGAEVEDVYDDEKGKMRFRKHFQHFVDLAWKSDVAFFANSTELSRARIGAVQYIDARLAVTCNGRLIQALAQRAVERRRLNGRR